MTKALQLQDANGAPITSFSFGVATPGTLTDPLPIRLVNVGTEATLNLRAWLTQGGAASGSLRVTVAGVVITGTSETITTALPDLAPGAYHAGTAEFLTPLSGADTGRLLAETD